MDKSYDVVIVGGGPGGCSAALYCARAGLSVLLLEKLAPGGQMAAADAVENYPGFDGGISGFELAQKMKNGAQGAGAVTMLAEVTDLELGSEMKLVRTASGCAKAKAVILAMGASPKTPGLEGEDRLVGHGLSYCAACDGGFFRGKIAAVMGGGNSAAADALTLSGLCRKVYLIHRRGELKAEKSYLEPLERAGNIEFIPNTEVKELVYTDKLTGLKLKDLNTGAVSLIDCDGLFVAIGRKPNTGLVEGKVALDEHGYILADETTCTDLPGIFAVGDIRTKPLRQIVTAAADGAVSSKYVQEYIHSIG